MPFDTYGGGSDRTLEGYWNPYFSDEQPTGQRFSNPRFWFSGGPLGHQNLMNLIADAGTAGMPRPESVPVDPRYEYQLGEIIKESRESPEQYSKRITEGTERAASLPGGLMSTGAMPISAAMTNMAKERVQQQAVARKTKSVWAAGKAQDSLRQEAFGAQKNIYDVQVGAYERWLKSEMIRKEARANIIKNVTGAAATVAATVLGGPAGGAVASGVTPKGKTTQMYNPDEFQQPDIDMYGENPYAENASGVQANSRGLTLRTTKRKRY